MLFGENPLGGRERTPQSLVECLPFFIAVVVGDWLQMSPPLRPL